MRSGRVGMILSRCKWGKLGKGKSPKAKARYMRQRTGLVVGMFDDMARQDQRDDLKYLVKNTEQVLSQESIRRSCVAR